MWLRRVYLYTLRARFLYFTAGFASASTEISETRHAFLSGESASLGMVVLDMHGTEIVV